MSLEDLREQNKQTAVQAALLCFSTNGIDNTKISDIACQAGLTERSLYRYFETKADLVLAAALLFWERIVQESEMVYRHTRLQELEGAEQIRLIFKAYANQYFIAKKELVFIQEAEAYLYRSAMLELIRNKPPLPFSSGVSPLAKAIQQGMKDGSVICGEAAERLYYNAYDSLLGLMQKMANTAQGSAGLAHEQQRLEEFCDLLADAFCR